MGPQPFGCGRGGILIGADIEGDRLQWGRNLSVAEGCRRGPRAPGDDRFNGAATFRLRRDVFSAGAWWAAARASMGPQPFGCGRSVGVGARHDGAPASMGPQPFGCGRQRLIAKMELAVDRLQWGRNLSVAEGSGRGCGIAENLCFNGAATFRLRKATCRPTLPPRSSASMGPQPFGCGRTGTPRRTSPTRALQWGRNLSVAEGLRCPACALLHKRLQWGRNLSVAEGQGPRPRPRRNGPASMGPQPFGCGRAPALSSITTPPLLQWGRNLSVAEGCRNARDLERVCMLQWGRNLSVAEGP